MRRLVTAIAAIVVMLGGLAGVAAPAYAVGCTTSGCNGRDPQAMGCSSGSSTIDEFTFLSARVELRRSNACGAVWTRVTASGVIQYPYVTAVAYSCKAATSSCYIGTQTAYLANGTRWTYMWSYLYWVKACIVWAGQNPSSACTAVQ